MNRVATLGLVGIAAAVIATGVALAPAKAQSGSRLCGWTADNGNGYTGILYEARQADGLYTTNCDEAIESISKKILSDPVASKLTWTKQHKETCESVGALFKSKTHDKVDMCEYMDANHTYDVVKTASTNSTTYDLH